jgi:outer membrane protein OmpA-like peptidoglycan-associated protein
MLNKGKFLLLGATVFAMSFSGIANAGHASGHKESYKPVVSSNGNIARNSHGNPVCTKWKGSASYCECASKEASVNVHSYHVYFAFDRAGLSKDAKSIIAEAVKHAKENGGKVHFALGGHADSSGKAGYNLKLSERRAKAVAAELKRHGIMEDEISIKAFGENNLIVNTGDNIKEAKNRVVEIALHLM